MSEFRKEENKQEVNDDKQQIRLYKQLAKEAQQVDQAESISKLLLNVVDKVGQTIAKPVPEGEKPHALVAIANSLTNGKFSELYKSMISVPDKLLSEQAIKVKQAMAEQSTKDAINKDLREMIATAKNRLGMQANDIKVPSFNFENKKASSIPTVSSFTNIRTATDLKQAARVTQSMPMSPTKTTVTVEKPITTGWLSSVVPDFMKAKDIVTENVLETISQQAGITVDGASQALNELIKQGKSSNSDSDSDATDVGTELGTSFSSVLMTNNEAKFKPSDINEATEPELAATIKMYDSILTKYPPKKKGKVLKISTNNKSQMKSIVINLLKLQDRYDSGTRSDITFSNWADPAFKNSIIKEIKEINAKQLEAETKAQATK